MAEENKHDEAVPVKCEVCLKEVPRSEAKVSEAQDYVLYFCGVECYDQWREGDNTEEKAGN